MSALTNFDEEYLSQLFEKILYGIKNVRRRTILEALSKQKSMSGGEIYQYLIRKGFLKSKRESNVSKIRKAHLNHLLEAGLIAEKDNYFGITLLGKDIAEIISGFKELEMLSPPTYPGIQRERILLEVKSGNKSHSGLGLKLKSQRIRETLKRMKEAGLIRSKHPLDSIRINHLYRFSISPYFIFIQNIKNLAAKRPWFTAYSFAGELKIQWRRVFGKDLDLKEINQLLLRGTELGEIVKNPDGTYRVSFKELKLSENENRILDLIKEGYTCCSEITKKIGLNITTAYKILKRLKMKNLIERKEEKVTIELTEKGEKIADALLRIKKCIKDHQAVEIAKF